MQTIGQRYEIQQELGEGGMGTVYRGLDRQTGNLVAIKKLKPQVANSELIERFKREGDALRALKHPNIVQLLDAVEEDGNNYLIMEYVAGGDLSQKLAKGGLALKEMLRLAIDLCDALTRAHKLDIIHRDLKPANILIAEDGTVRLTDFGVAHFGSKQRMTTVDNIIGTIDYLAPEIFQSSHIDKRADIWAVGVILFEMLAGQRPFQGTTINQIVSNILVTEIPDLEELCVDAPPALVDLVYRILTRNPDERIPSTRLIGAELEAILDESPITPHATNEVFVQVISSAFKTTPLPDSKNNLPRPGTPFVGREDDLAAVKKLLFDPQIQLVTIIAQGGMGKTRLSIEAAKAVMEDYPQGVYFVELAPLSTPDDIPSAIAEAINYPFNGNGTRQEQIVAYFRDKKCLLILDNFEHLTEGHALVQAILQASQTKIIVTSRVRLNLSGETLYTLEGMDLPRLHTQTDARQYAAIRLFLDSARRVRADFSPEGEELADVIRICSLVHGLPLGLVLAASWLDALSIREVASEIASNIDFLETTMHDIPERQRSLRAVFDYSWKMLSEEEQEAFARLAVFRGGMSREAAQAISGANIRSLQLLVNKSLLRRDTVTGRYEAHELLRQYAEQYLKDTGRFEEVRAKAAAYYADFALNHEAELKGKRQSAAIAEMDADFENIKLAWRYAIEKQDANILGKLLEPVFWYCTFRNRNVEGQELFQMARSIWKDDSLLAGRLMVRYPVAVPDYTATYERGLEIARQHQEQHEIAFCLRQLGHWLSHTLQKPEGMQRMEESIAIFEALNEKFCLAMVLDDLAWSYRIKGQLDQQRRHVERSIELRREIGDKMGMASALRNLGGALGGMGSGSMEPLHKWLEALELSREIGDKRNIAWNAYMVNLFWQFDGELDKALPYQQEASMVADEIKEQIVSKLCLLSQALDIVLSGGDTKEARRLLTEGYPPNSPYDFRTLIHHLAHGFIAAADGDNQELREAALKLYKLGKERGHPIIGMTIFFGALFLARDQQFEFAAKWLGVGEQTTAYRIARIWPYYLEWRKRLRDKLGEAAFVSAASGDIKSRMLALSEEAAVYIENH